MRLLLKYPTRSRPHLVKSTIKLYMDKASGQFDINWMLSCDLNDSSMNNGAMKDYLYSMYNVTCYFGDNHSKIEACNANMDRAPHFDILVLVSDDMRPIADNWDKMLVNKMRLHFPNLDGCLHFNDGRVKGPVCITQSIMGRRMYEDFGYLYHPDYISLWCDNEFTDEVYLKGKVAYEPTVIVEHQWTDRTGRDALHVKNEGYYQIDGDTYRLRKAAGFPRHRTVKHTWEE